MLKLDVLLMVVVLIAQPPSGGCVLKLTILQKAIAEEDAAAFGRLCVETGIA